MAAASGAAHLPACRVLAAIGSIVRIRPVETAHPLPTVSGHVERAVRARAFGKAPHRTQLIPAAAEVRPGTVRCFVSPRKLSPVGAARRLLPLRIGGQAFARPGGIGPRARPEGLDNGMILVSGVAAPPAVAPVPAPIVVVDDVIILAARAPCPDGIEKSRE